jgi:hypothetical protein
MCRRGFFSSTAGLMAGLLYGNIPFFSSKLRATEQEFVIVNGWVLTRADVAKSEATVDVIRLQ